MLEKGSLESFIFQTAVYEHPKLQKDLVDGNILDIYTLDEYDLIITYFNGDAYMYDSFDHTLEKIKYDSSYEISDDDIVKEFSKRLDKWMRRRGYNQEELSKLINVSQSSISKYLNGNQIPNALIIKKIASVLNIKIDDLYFHF